METQVTLEELRNNHKKILDCEVQDADGLNDFQKIPDDKACFIDRVGIDRYRIPLNFAHQDGAIYSHDCQVNMSIGLLAGKTGVNMSRFCALLQRMGGQHTVNDQFFQDVLDACQQELRDFDHENLIENSYLTLSFPYSYKQKSLKSDNWGWQYYQCELAGHLNAKGELRLKMTLNYEYSSTCPCSLSLAKQYEKDYADGKTTEGSGIAAAHAQRSCATIAVEYIPFSGLVLEDLILLAKKALPTETQSLVKRVDEQAFAILNGEHPMFVEHACRRLGLVLDVQKQITSWEVHVEHFESLHGHNAVATLRSSVK